MALPLLALLMMAIRMPKMAKPPGAMVMMEMLLSLSTGTAMPNQVPAPKISRMEAIASMARV